MREKSQYFLYQAIRPANDKSKLQALTHPDLDWNWITATALEHGVAPLLYWNTKGLNGIPTNAVQTLEEDYYVTLLRNNHRLNSLQTVLHAFDQASIPAIVLKGAMLAVVLYPDVGLRPFSDIDILINQAQLEDAETILERLGYIELHRSERPRDWHRRVVKYEKHLSYVKDDTTIELHWNFSNYSDKQQIPISELFETAQQTDIGMILAPDKMLLHFCFHLHRHTYYPLIRLCDVALLLNRYSKSINWKHLIYQAKNWRVTLPLACVMHRLKDLWGYEIPELSGLLAEKKRSTDLISTIISKSSDNEHLGKFITFLDFDYRNPRLIFDKIFQKQETVIRKHHQASSSLWMFGYYFARPFVLTYKILKLLLLLLKKQSA